MSKLVKDLNISDKVRFGSYKVGDSEISPIIWSIAAKNHPGYPENSITLLTDKIIDLRPFNLKSINEAKVDLDDKECNNYGLSNIRHWLNTVSGFLSHFNTNEFSKILDTSIEIFVNNQNENKIENLIDKIFLLSVTEVGLIHDSNKKEGNLIELFNDTNNLMVNVSKQFIKYGNINVNYWDWWLRTSFNIRYPCGVRIVNAYGKLDDNSVYLLF